MNTRQMSAARIHEAIPGHYLQLVVRTAAVPRPARVPEGLFAEGWAVYVTQVMMDLGYGGDDPALLLNHWKYYLRASPTRSSTSASTRRA